MKLIVTLVFSVCIAFTSFAEGDRTPIGSLPCKNGCVMVVQEYLSKAKLPEKVVVVSPNEDVFAFTGGVVTKVLKIGSNYSVFVERDNYYYVYNNLNGVAIDDGERLEKGEFIGITNYNDRYDEYEMEMQIWHNTGSKTMRLANTDVVSVLKGTPPSVVMERAKARAAAEAKRKAALKARYAKSKKSKYSKSSKYRKTTAKKKTTSKARKPVAKKKAPVKKKR